MASAPPRLSTRHISRQAVGTSSTLRMPNATVTASTDESAAGIRVASPRTSVTSLASPARLSPRAPAPPHLVPADIEHRAREINADDARGARRRGPGGDRQIRRPRADVEHALAARELQRADRPLAPAAVDPGAEHVIEEV